MGVMKKVLVPSLPPPHYTLSMSTRKDDDRLNTKGWIADKACLMTVDTGASVMIGRPDITVGLLGRELTRPYILQMASGRPSLS
jgi:hypothetical protein